MGGTLPIDLYRNSELGRPLSFGEVDQNFTTINGLVNNIQLIDNTISNGYTLTLNESGKLLLIDSSSKSIIITIPSDNDVLFNIGQHIDIVQYGSNEVSIAADKDVTLNSYNGSRIIAAQYVGVTIIKVASNEWLLIGNLI